MPILFRPDKGGVFAGVFLLGGLSLEKCSFIFGFYYKAQCTYNSLLKTDSR